MTDADMTLEPAIKALRDGQERLDADGIMVGVSRQALDEVLAFLSRPTLPREGQGFPQERVCLPDPQNPGARIVGFRIREGDEAWGVLGLSEPLAWLDRALSPSPAVRDGAVEAAVDFDAIIRQVETRCMAVDGPVTPTLKEITEGELRKLWLACERIRALSTQEQGNG